MVIATGFFDGVHLGHRLVIDLLVKTAKARGEESMVVTFWPHPRTVLQDEARSLRLLNTLNEKKALIESCGVDKIEVMPFNKEFSCLSAEDFFKTYIIGLFGGTAIILGYDNRMGGDEGDTEDISEIAKKCGLEVIRAGKINNPSGEAISSTKIRKLISEGEVEAASNMLGYDYSLHGVVVVGKQLGRTIGFPTANMQLYEPLKQIPCNGVYFVKAETLGGTFYGMCNIGVRPTVDSGGAVTIETNIFDFNEDIYGLDLIISFISKIREERCFDSIDALQSQLSKDKEACIGLFRK